MDPPAAFRDMDSSPIKRPRPAKPLAYSLYLRLTSPAALISYFPLKKNTYFSFAASHLKLLLRFKTARVFLSLSLHFLFPCVTCNNRTNPLQMFRVQRSRWELLLAAPNFTSLKGFVCFHFSQKSTLSLAHFGYGPTHGNSGSVFGVETLSGPLQPGFFRFVPTPFPGFYAGSVGVLT